MKSIFILTFASLLAGFVKGDLAAVPNITAGETPDCSCAKQAGNSGCVISVAAPKGFKCECYKRFLFGCTGTVHPCQKDEQCPGNRADYCACKLGGGNCGGYRQPLSPCTGLQIPMVEVEGLGYCECSYRKGGCHITKAAPIGWRCVCAYSFFWGCTGWAQQCQVNEICLGHDFTYCGCKNAGGDCGAYKFKKPSCPSPFISKCDCKDQKAWRKGLYTIDEVEYDLKKGKIESLEPLVLAKKFIPNFSSREQMMKLSVSKELAQTSSYTYTKGIKIAGGVAFGGGGVVAGGAGLFVSGSFSHTWGKKETKSLKFQNEFTCNGAPHRHTQCSVDVQHSKITVPYVMKLRHKIFKNCVCASRGLFQKVQFYNMVLHADEIGYCYDKKCSKNPPATVQGVIPQGSQVSQLG